MHYFRTPSLLIMLAALTACQQPNKAPESTAASGSMSGGAGNTSTTSGIPRGAAKSELMAGNARFLSGGMQAHSWQQERVVHTGRFGQSPSVGVLSCADS